MIKSRSQTRSSSFWRRRYSSALLGPVILSLLAATLACRGGESKTDGGGKRVILLGFDGMDYEVTTRLMAEGRLPNLSRLGPISSPAWTREDTASTTSSTAARRR